MQIVYVGESPSRDIPTSGGVIVAAHGVPVDVPDDLAASLLEQDTYQPVNIPPAQTKEESD